MNRPPEAGSGGKPEIPRVRRKPERGHRYRNPRKKPHCICCAADACPDCIHGLPHRSGDQQRQQIRHNQQNYSQCIYRPMPGKKNF